MKKPKILGIIPARGRSKGLSRKNIRLLAGKPLIAYTIESALDSVCLDKLVTSTEDIEIAQIAKQFGSEYIIRPESLAQDDTSSEAVILHVLASLSEHFDAVALLQPTAPLRIAKDIDECVNYLFSEQANSIITVTRTNHYHPIHLYQKQNGYLVPLMDEPKTRRRQDLPIFYARNGLVYVCKTDWIQKHKNIMSPDCLGYETPIERSVNIDSAFDLAMAEFLINYSLHVHKEEVVDVYAD